MNCLENVYIQQFERQGSLRDEQSVGEINPLFALGTQRRHSTRRRAFDTLHLSNATKHSLHTIYCMPGHGHIARFSRYVLLYILFNITPRFIRIHTH
jgi:hypothetical protein